MKKSLKKARFLLILALAIVMISAILEGYLSIYMMKIVDTTLTGNKSLFIEQGKILILLSLVLLPINILLSYGKGLYKKKALVTIKKDYMEGIFNKNINEFQKDNNAKYLSSLTNDMNTIEINYIEAIYEIGFNIIYFLVSIVVISSVSPSVLGIGLLVSGISTLLAMALGRPLQRHQIHRSKLLEDYTSYIKEVLSAFHIIKSNNLSHKVKKDFYNKSKGVQDKGYIIDKITTYFLAIQNLTMSLSFFSITAIVVYMAIKGHMTLGGVILVVSNMESLIYPLMQLGEWLPKVFSVKSLFNDLDENLKNHDNHVETLKLESFKDSIRIEELFFGYDENMVLDNINLEFKKGEKYLIIGPSGGGKSTLLKLLRKYFNPSNGKIYIDGMNLIDITRNSYFKSISNVEQQVFLFEDTLRNNITLYKEFSEEELNDVIKKAGLEGFIKGLPQGLDTMIYDNGKNISGGEKSRIAIARGLISNADIIFLDEAFSSLDGEIAIEIEKTLLNLQGVTIINVSHVIFEETRGKYDSIFMVKDGSVLTI